jgi:hypothetical protein
MFGKSISVVVFNIIILLSLISRFFLFLNNSILTVLSPTSIINSAFDVFQCLFNLRLFIHQLSFHTQNVSKMVRTEWIVKSLIWVTVSNITKMKTLYPHAVVLFLIYFWTLLQLRCRRSENFIIQFCSVMQNFWVPNF